MKFKIDENLPDELVGVLERAGHDARPGPRDGSS